MPGPTVSIVSTRAVLEAGIRRGVDGTALLASHGLSPAVLADPDARLPAEAVAELWREAAAAAHEPELAVHAAVELPWRAYRVLDYLAACAGTVGEAIALASRYFRIVHDSVHAPIVPRGDGAALRIERACGGPLPAPYVDYALAAFVSRMSYISDGPVHPVLRLRRPAPVDLRGHQRAFGPHLTFGADLDEAFFPPSLWQRPTHAADAVLRELLEAHAQALVDRLSSERDALVDVREAALAAMRAGRTDLAWVARQLDTSARTLQHRLTASHTTWRALLEELRREAAAQYLRDPDLSIDDVAVLLGYAEASTFHRAFRRWTGQSPGAYRRDRSL